VPFCFCLFQSCTLGVLLSLVTPFDAYIKITQISIKKKKKIGCNDVDVIAALSFSIAVSPVA
jgi:hypothetical protein